MILPTETSSHHHHTHKQRKHFSTIQNNHTLHKVNDIHTSQHLKASHQRTSQPPTHYHNSESMTSYDDPSIYRYPLRAIQPLNTDDITEKHYERKHYVTLYNKLSEPSVFMNYPSDTHHSSDSRDTHRRHRHDTMKPSLTYMNVSSQEFTFQQSLGGSVKRTNNPQTSNTNDTKICHEYDLIPQLTWQQSESLHQQHSFQRYLTSIQSPDHHRHVKPHSVATNQVEAKQLPYPLRSSIHQYHGEIDDVQKLPSIQTPPLERIIPQERIVATPGGKKKNRRKSKEEKNR